MTSLKFLSFIAISLLVLSVVSSKKKDTISDDTNGDASEPSSKGGDNNKFYRKRDMQRMAELMGQISELQQKLSDEHAFLSELMLSSLSIPKPQLPKLDNNDILTSARNMTKMLGKFYAKNTLTGRPQRMVEKRLIKMVKIAEDEE
ncbi:uncharacterized protein LOC134849136 [Symsagittifera roscoffensis]|uniref:uncharacterized protein LOC134849136 n=1 Tax=Symsagittifera roscoffensis TaxID=84072 RepID=UPI00307BBB0F